MKTQYLMRFDRFGARNEVEVLRTDERTAKRRRGVVIAQACDEAAGLAADPVVLATHGTVFDLWDVLGGAA